jgi:hypothetical protein
MRFRVADQTLRSGFGVPCLDEPFQCGLGHCSFDLDTDRSGIESLLILRCVMVGVNAHQWVSRSLK